MAEIRFNYGDKFTQTTNTNTGIGSTIPAAKLDIAGGTSAGSLRVSGIATLSSYQGFVNTKLSTTEDLIVEAGQSGSVSGEVVIGTGQTISVSTGATTGQGGIQSLKVYETFMPPVGGTADRPTDVKPGMVYYNKDFKTIEFWDGNFWKQVDNTTQSGRQVVGDGFTPSSYRAATGTFNAHTLGNEVHFGNLTETRATYGGGSGSATRGLFVAGYGPYVNIIDYITIASEGNAIDFGDTTVQSFGAAALSSSTRSVNFAGYVSPGTGSNVIDYVEISTLGNALDFGDSGNSVWTAIRGASPTRGVYGHMGEVFEFVTIASKGNSIEFTDSVTEITQSSGSSNSIRLIVAVGGDETVAKADRLSYVTIPTLGENIAFGDLIVPRQGTGSSSTNTRTIIAGGNASSTLYNAIEFVTIQTLGNAQDFGDLMLLSRNNAQVSDSHGGLGGF
jgi:hypothetical protein